MILVIIRLQLAILFCFAFFLLLAGASLEGVLHWNNIQKYNVFRENCLILLGLSLLRIVVKKKLLLSHWNQKLFFALFAQQKKHLHVHYRSVLK